VSASAELLVDCRCTVGEGPSWDERDGALLWVDIVTGDVFHLTLASGEPARMRIAQQVSAVLPRASGGYLLTLQDGVFAVERIEQGAPLATLRQIEVGQPRNRLNDAKCDAAGRMWGGTLSRDRVPGAGALYRLGGDLSLTQVLNGVTVSNGIGWSPDGTRMYYVDSVPRTLDVLDYDMASGEASNRRRLVEVAEEVGSPDGLAVDVEGCIWLAVWGSGALYRYAPDGTLQDVVAVPTKNVASCCFGGPDLGDLFVTSASAELNAQELAADPGAGGVFRLRPGVRGLPTAAFAG
jgi:sugar lactone lactonase YvrE